MNDKLLRHVIERHDRSATASDRSYVDCERTRTNTLTYFRINIFAHMCVLLEHCGQGDSVGGRAIEGARA